MQDGDNISNFFNIGMIKAFWAFLLRDEQEEQGIKKNSI